jgi:hypothetical protein
MTTQGMLKATPVPAITKRPPARQSVDNAPIDSDGSATLLSPGTNADDGFLTPRGKTTPFHAAVPQAIIQPPVTTGNTFGDFASTNNDKDTPPDNKNPPPVPPPAASTMTTPVPTYWDVHRAVEEQLDSLIMDFHQSEKAHQQRLRANFRAMMNDV